MMTCLVEREMKADFLVLSVMTLKEEGDIILRCSRYLRGVHLHQCFLKQFRSELFYISTMGLIFCSERKDVNNL